MAKFDGLLMTLDEASNIVDAIKSLKLVCENVFVLDSFSSDQTVELAEAAGAVVLQRRFDNYSNQRNFALSNFSFEAEFVLFFDADERLTDQLVHELDKLTLPNDVDTLFIRRHDVMWGTIIRRASGYPTWGVRGLRVGAVEYERSINEGVKSIGKSMYLESHFMHYPLSKGISWWLNRHQKYAEMEAFEIFSGKYALKWNDLFSLDPLKTRFFLKSFVYNLPGRPFFVFFIFYFGRLGILDGRAGLAYSFMRFVYECMITVHLFSLKLNCQGKS